MPDPMKRPLRIHDPLLAAALAAVAMTGCHSTMTSAHGPSPAGSDAVPPNMVPPPGHGPFTGTVADWPLWFVRHNFGARCFDTQSCEVLYNGFPHGSDGPSPSVASYGRSLDKLLTASFLSIANRSEEHTSELQSIMRISYAVFCLKKKKQTHKHK